MSVEKAQADLNKLQKSIDQLGENVAGLLSKQDKEIQTNGEASRDTAKKLDAMNEKWAGFESEIKGIQKDLQEKISVWEKRMERRSKAGFGSGSDRKSLGKAFIESECFQKAQTDGDLRAKKFSFEKGDIWLPGQRKDTILTSAELGAAAPTFRWDEIINLPVRPRKLFDLIPSINVNTNKIEYPEETVKHELYAELESQAASGQPDVVLEYTAEGFFEGQIVTLSPGLGVEEEAEIDTIDYDTRTLTMTGNLTNTHAAGNSCISDKFVYTPEAKIKPKSRVEFDLAEATIKTLATIMPVSKQMLEDAPALQQYIDMRMNEFIELSKESELLYGDNSTRRIQGILTHPDIQNYSWSSGTVGDTKLDAIRRAMTLAMLSFLPPDSVVLHPNDFEDIETTKATDGHYVFAQVQSGNGVTRVWRMNVVESPVIEETHALVGGFSTGAVIWDRQMAEMSISDQNRDWWEKNVIAMRLEERMAQSVIRPQAFVDVYFNSPPAAP